MTISNLLLWLIFILFFSAMFTWILYQKGTETSNKILKKVLPLIRFSSLFILGLLLLNPWFQKIQTEEFEKLNLIFVDNSSSLKTFFNDTVKQEKLTTFLSTQSEDENVQILQFGKTASPLNNLTWDDDYTSLQSPFDYIVNNFSDHEIANVTIISDGILNQGSDPSYQEFPYTVHTILAGDTTRYSDVFIERVLFSDIAFIGDEVVFQVDIGGENIQAQQAKLTLQVHNGDNWITQDHKTIVLNNRQLIFATESLNHIFTMPGKQQARAIIEIADFEKNKLNNVYNFHIEVIDSRQKIAIIAVGPHPDISAIVNTLDRNKNYETEVILLGENQIEDESNIDIFVLYDLPNRKSRNYNNQIKSILSNNKPVFLILSPYTDYSNLNGLQNFTQFIPRGRNLSQEALPYLNSSFSLYSIDQVLWRNRLKTLPPLHTAFVDQKINSGSINVFNQKIGSIETPTPLHSFMNHNGKKISILFGNEFFRWAMQEYAFYNDNTFFQEWIEQSFQYLGMREDKRKLRAQFDKKLYEENEKILLSVQTYNDSYEPVVESEIMFELLENNGNVFPYTFNKNKDKYSLSIGPFPAGVYNYSIKDIEGKRTPINGQFQVRKNNLEFKNNVENSLLLQDLSSSNNGELYYFEDNNWLNTLTDQNKNKSTLLLTHKITSYLLDLKILFFLLFSLLVLEWILRRISIGY